PQLVEIRDRLFDAVLEDLEVVFRQADDGIAVAVANDDVDVRHTDFDGFDKFSLWKRGKRKQEGQGCRAPGTHKRVAKAYHCCATAAATYRPVMLSGFAAISSGVPTATTSPPPSPPSGPRSMTWSAASMSCRLCSMTSTELPRSIRSRRVLMSCSTSVKCSPVVGSSKRKRRGSPALPCSARNDASLSRC